MLCTLRLVAYLLLSSVPFFIQGALAFIPGYSHVNFVARKLPDHFHLESETTDDNDATKVTSSDSSPPAPVLNGKRVLPYRVMMAGLKGHKVAAVYAVLDSSFQRGSEGWDKASCVGVSQDLETTLRTLSEQDATELKVAHVRALSFIFPQPNAMQEVASQWRAQATEAGATLNDGWADDVLNYLFEDDDDDDDDDDDEDGLMMAAQAMASVSTGDSEIISPFDSSSDAATTVSATQAAEEVLQFTRENVDKVLDEVRPYLIADGGNVAVERVDEVEKNVYLKLEGACGSCASSTVTMSMGIERVLKENFAEMNEIIQVEDDDGKPKELTSEAVQAEIDRLRPAMLAMGALVELCSIDVATGVADIRFRGANKVQQGLELALLDVPYVNKVNFVMGEE